MQIQKRERERERERERTTELRKDFTELLDANHSFEYSTNVRRTEVSMEIVVFALGQCCLTNDFA
jgi:hypothetical protein